MSIPKRPFDDIQIWELKYIYNSWCEAIDNATPILQAGGRYCHLLQLGDSIIRDGIVRLAEELDKKPK